MRVEAMSTSIPPPTEPLRSSLLRKLFLLALVVCALALGLRLLTGHIHTASLSLQIILSNAVCGLVSGTAARLVFRRQIRLLQFAAGIATLLGGQILLGLLTGWQIGVGPLEAGRPSVDWAGLGQLLLGSGTTLLALQAWRREVVPPLPATKQPRAESPVVPSTRTAKRVRRRTSHAEPIAAAASAPVAPRPKRKRGLRRTAQVQLSEEVEHRCPYCLELVEPDDPRGTVECKVCHTLHHADCWSITGACQVPHYNA
jgi:hypothetical protein